MRQGILDQTSLADDRLDPFPTWASLVLSHDGLKHADIYQKIIN